jgi:CyaY protein
MDETGFARQAADTLKALDWALGDLDGLEADLAGDVLTLEFEDGPNYVVNSHSAAQQIWVAAERRAWHLSQDAVSGKWIDTREGHELFSLLEELLSKKLGRKVQLSGTA